MRLPIKKSVVFRKVATALWAESGDPSVYGFFELDVTGIKDRSWVLPVFLKALGDTMQTNPALTAMVRRKRVELRKDQSVSVMVNIPGLDSDLSALHISMNEKPSVESIRALIDQKAHLIRKEKDPHLGPLLKAIDLLPHFMVKFFVSLYCFLIYDLNTRLGIRSIPMRPFGSVIVSNIGSLGLTKALLPLVPIARASLMLSLGQVTEEIKVINGSAVIRDIIHVGVTFDHRLFDGSHAAKMLKDFQTSFDIHKKTYCQT